MENLHKIEKAIKEKKINPISVLVKVTRTHNAEKFISQTAKGMSAENKRKFKNILIQFQTFLDQQ